eukprot:NODE_224_length_12322_cov_0.795549.p6 type:complete len:230 gc:universal NODE_224_length_12322_cov_0.795549:4062-3373(-)
MFLQLLFALDCSKIVKDDETFDISSIPTTDFELESKPFGQTFRVNPCRKVSDACGNSCLIYTKDDTTVTEMWNTNDSPEISVEKSPFRLVLRYETTTNGIHYITTLKLAFDTESKSVTVSETFHSRGNTDKTAMIEIANSKFKHVSQGNNNGNGNPAPTSQGLGWFSILLIILSCYFALHMAYRFFVLKDRGLDIVPHLWLFRRIGYALEDGFNWIRHKISGNSQYMQL